MEQERILPIPKTPTLISKVISMTLLTAQHTVRQDENIEALLRRRREVKHERRMRMGSLIGSADPGERRGAILPLFPEELPLAQ